MAASRSSTATPMWSIRPNNTAASLRPRVGQPFGGRDRRDGYDALSVTRHDRLDRLPLEHLMRQQLSRDLLQDVAVLLDQLAGAARGEVGQLLLLLVDRPPRGLGHRVVVGRHPA